MIFVIKVNFLSTERKIKPFASAQRDILILQTLTQLRALNPISIHHFISLQVAFARKNKDSDHHPTVSIPRRCVRNAFAQARQKSIQCTSRHSALIYQGSLVAQINLQLAVTSGGNKHISTSDS